MGVDDGVDAAAALVLDPAKDHVLLPRQIQQKPVFRGRAEDDDVADLDENGEKTETTHKELRGIQYSKLVPVLLKEVQKLRAELNQMKVN